MIFGTDCFYRNFKLRKRSGGFRTISAPFPSLLDVQRWINFQILSKIKVSICATGFRPKKSIATNAKLHCGRDELIKIDIKEFFPSIGIRRIIHIFRELGYPENVSFALARLCCLNDQLPQGSAASPALANIVCRKLDLRLYRLARKNKLRYTRYADDIVISGQSINKSTIRLVFEIIEEEGFEINSEKIRFLGMSDKKIVTGLDITSGTPRVTRRFRRELKKDIYFVWTSGLATHLSRRRIFSPNYLAHLAGRLRFWATIEPDCKQMLMCKKRLEDIFRLHDGQQVALRA